METQMGRQTDEWKKHPLLLFFTLSLFLSLHPLGPHQAYPKLSHHHQQLHQYSSTLFAKLTQILASMITYVRDFFLQLSLTK